MLEYLLNFDVDADNIIDANLEYDLDINDQTILQDQINNVRKSYRQLIKLYDNIEGEYLNSKSELSSLLRNYQLEYENKNERLNAISQDLKIVALQEKVDALKESLKTVDNELAFVKADIRILSNSMYKK